MSPQAIDHLQEARFFQENSARLIKDSFLACSVALTGTLLVNSAVDKLFSDERAQAVNEVILHGGTGITALVGAAGLLGAVSYQVRAGLEKHRAQVSEKAETRLAQLRKYTPPLSEISSYASFPNTYDLSSYKYD